MNPDEYVSQLRVELKKLQGLCECVLSGGSFNPTYLDSIYALLHNIKNTADNADYGLVTQICALACGILQRRQDADVAALKAVEAHIDALAIIADHELNGDGGALGQEMVSELAGLAKVVNA